MDVCGARLEKYGVGNLSTVRKILCTICDRWMEDYGAMVNTY